MADDRFRRIAPRPERQHLPFEVGSRGGPLLKPWAARWLVFSVVVLILAVFAGVRS